MARVSLSGIQKRTEPLRQAACLLPSFSESARAACVRTFIEDGCREEAFCVLCVLCSCRSFAHVHGRTRSVAPSSGHLHTHHDHGPCARMYVCMPVCVHVGRCELVFRQINAERRVRRPVAVASWKKGAGPPKDPAESEWQGTSVTVVGKTGKCRCVAMGRLSPSC